MTVAILTLVETRGVGEKQAGTASGLFFAAAEIGGAGGPILLGVLYDATGGFDAGLYLLAGVGALLAVAALRLRRVSELPPTRADRKGDVEGKSVSGRVDIGGRRVNKKKNNTTNSKP